jgi:hypothetical protein
MQAHYDPSLPYWVATDHAVWGTFQHAKDALFYADEVVRSQPFGERVIVTAMKSGSTIWSRSGTNERVGEPTRRPAR